MPAPIPANDFRALWADIGEDALSAIARMGESGWYVLGQEVEQFERDLAGFHGVTHVVGVASGLDAIEIALRAAGIGPGDEVLTTPLTAFATTLAIVRAGAIPRFCDVDEEGLLDLGEVERTLAANPAIRAIVPVHLYGHMLDVDRLLTITGQYNCLVVEDAAQAIGAAQDGAAAGSKTVAAATSFYPTKNLGALGDGGALLTNDDEIARSARQLRDYGQVAKYEHAVPGLNSRLDELHAAVLRTAVLPRLRGALERRNVTADAYLSGIDHAALRLPEPARTSTWHLFPVFTADPGQREELREHLAAHGVQTAVHYPILASAQRALGDLATDGYQPVAQRLAQTEVSLPIHPYLSANEVQRVIDACNAW